MIGSKDPSPFGPSGLWKGSGRIGRRHTRRRVCRGSPAIAIEARELDPRRVRQ